MKKKQSIPSWVWILIIILIFTTLLFYVNNKSNALKLENYGSCIDSCSFEFDKCLSNITIIKMEKGQINNPEDSLPCHWSKDSCIYECALYGV